MECLGLLPFHETGWGNAYDAGFRGLPPGFAALPGRGDSDARAEAVSARAIQLGWICPDFSVLPSATPDGGYDQVFAQENVPAGMDGAGFLFGAAAPDGIGCRPDHCLWRRAIRRVCHLPLGIFRRYGPGMGHTGDFDQWHWWHGAPLPRNTGRIYRPNLRRTQTTTTLYYTG